MTQKQQKRARTERADTRELNQPKTTSTKRMKELTQRGKAESSRVASEPGVTSTSRAVRTKNIDTSSEHSTESQEESEDKTPYANQWSNKGLDDSSEIHQQARESYDRLF